MLKSGHIVNELREHAFDMHPHSSGKLMEEAADELETLLDQVERLLSDKNMWRNTCSKLIGMMLPFSMLMRPDEIDDLKIILEEIR